MIGGVCDGFAPYEGVALWSVWIGILPFACRDVSDDGDEDGIH